MGNRAVFDFGRLIDFFLVVLLDERERRRREYFLGISLVSHEKKNKMEKVRIGMTDSTFFYLSREVELRIRSE